MFGRSKTTRQTNDSRSAADDHRMVELEKLRAAIWKQALIADDETSLVQSLLDTAGPMLGCENISFMSYDETLEDVVVELQWRSDGKETGLGEVVPRWIFNRFIGAPYVQVVFDEMPRWLKPILNRFVEKYGTRSTLVIPYGDSHHPEGYISVNHYRHPKKYSDREIELFIELSKIIHLRSKQLQSQAALQQ